MADRTPTPTPAEVESLLDQIVTNRFIAARAVLIDQIEPRIANVILPAIEESRERAIAKLRTTDLSDFQRKRYAEYVAWCNKELSKPFTNRTKQLQSDLETVAKDQAAQAAAILSFDGKAAIANVGISAAMAKAIVDTPVGGASLQGWMTKLGVDFADRVQRQTTAAMLEGQTYRQMVKELLGPNGPLANGTRHQAITLARTYVQSIAQRAQDEVMDANADILRGKQWLATFDNRTCKLCAPLDGRVYSAHPRTGEYPLSSIPPHPRHPRCRCLVVPVTKSWSDMFKGDMTAEDIAASDEYDKWLAEGGRPYSIRERYKVGPKKGQVKPVGVGGAPIAKGPDGRPLAGVTAQGQTFEGWMRQHDTVAQDILGPRRYALWQEGKFKLDDLIGRDNKLRTIIKRKNGATIGGK